MNTTQQSKEHLVQQAYRVHLTETNIPGTRWKRDLFGFMDMVAIRADVPGVLGVQTTTTHNLAARLQKIKASADAAIWLQAGNRILVHGWDGTTLTERHFTLGDI
jgi:hypothetical protein